MWNFIKSSADFVGNILDFTGSNEEYRAGERAAMFNWETSMQNAAIARDQAKEKERRLRVQQRKIIGRARANYGASGVAMAGSPLAVLQESAASAELDALTVRYQGELQAFGFERQAEQYKRRDENLSQARIASGTRAFFDISSGVVGGME